MDRTIVYPGSIPQDTDILSANRNAMVALGVLMQATLGTNTVVDGLACTTTTPPSMSIQVGPGSIATLATVDATAYGTLAADTADALVKMGVNLTAGSFPLIAPAGTGQAVNYLVQASFAEADTAPVVLPYYNAANPSQPYSGPANAGVAQNTQRLQRVLVQVLQGIPAVAGTQATPAPSSGAVGLFIVTVNYNQSYIATGSITPYPAAPFIQHKLPALSPGYSNMQVLTTSLNWVPPQGVTRVKLRMVGGGGGGATGGGGGAGSVEGFYGVTPGIGNDCTVGAAGSAGSPGGASSFGALAVAAGGAGGAGSSGGAGGAGSGTGLLTTGRAGQAGLATGSLLIGGSGGGSCYGQGGAATFAASGSNLAGQAGVLPGAGGAGGVGSGAGGAGAAGLIIVEW